MPFRVGAIIVCAGEGKRLGKVDKSVLNLQGKPLFYHAFRVFKEIKEIKEIVLVLRRENFNLAKKIISQLKAASRRKTKKVLLIKGGQERSDSVYNGVTSLSEDINYVLIHDGARPFVTKEMVRSFLKELKKYPAVICGIKSPDTLKLTEKGYVKKTLRRENIFLAQTPQGFKKELLLEAYNKLERRKVLDDSQLLELMGKRVKVVKGDGRNFKITYPGDVVRAKAILQMIDYRIGLGFDVHRFTKNRKGLVLGGVRIPAGFGVDAVSDGDVILHSVSDALCGACSLGDIGDYFPPSSKKSKGIDSREIVNLILGKMAKRFTIANIDITIVAEKPRLAFRKRAIVKSLCSIFSLPEMNLKMKSKEGLDILGGRNAISCFTIVLVKRR